jgi:hypothetical protein
MTIKQRERQQLRIRHRIMMTIPRDAVGECDKCHNRDSLYSDNIEDGDFRYCADGWAGFSAERRQLNHMAA